MRSFSFAPSLFSILDAAFALNVVTMAPFHLLIEAHE